MYIRPQLLPDGVSLVLRLVRNPSEFSLYDGTVVTAENKSGDYVVKIENPVLHVKRVALTDGARLSLARAIRARPFSIPIRRRDCTSYSIAQGTMNKRIEHLIDGTLPKSLVVRFVSSAAYNGSVSKNPFYFQHFNVSSVQCFINGQANPIEPFKINSWDQESGCVRPYTHLMKLIGSWRQGIQCLKYQIIEINLYFDNSICTAIDAMMSAIP